MREADRGVLARVSALGGLKRKSPTTGAIITKQGEFDVLRFLLVEAGPSYSAQAFRNGAISTSHPAMRRGRKIAKCGDGAETGYRSLLDVAQGMGLRAVKKVSVRTRASSERKAMKVIRNRTSS